jgi:DNA-binding transcriptional LysR family regulator
MIETSHLLTLLTIAKHKSFSRAAEELQVTQSAISQCVKGLEVKLEVKLFKRSGKEVVLTPEGEKLNLFAKKMIDGLHETIQEIKHDKNEMSGVVRIGALAGVAKSWLYPVVLSAAHQYPEVFIDFKLGGPHELVDGFQRFAQDIIIVPEHDVPDHGEKIFYREEKLVLVFPKNFPYKMDDELSIELLSSLPLITFEHEDSLFKNWCLSFFGHVPHKVRKILAINSHGGMLSAVSQGIGIAVLPSHVLKRSYYRDKVQVLDKKYEVPYKKFYLVYHKESVELKRIRTFVDLIIQDKHNDENS